MTASGSPRERVAQHGPAADLDLRRFPARTVPAGAEVFRAHRSDRGPWWFGSDGGGRFDLPVPRGTCYVADTALVAVRERLGVVLGSRRQVPAAALDRIVVSSLTLVGAVSLANLRSARASAFGVLNELATMVPYEVPQSWARAFDEVDLDGVRYGARFSTGRAGSLAIYGSAGDHTTWPTDDAPRPAAEVPGSPVLRPTPALDELTVVPTPRRRAARSHL